MRLSNSLMVAVPVLVAFAIGDVNRAEATNGLPVAGVSGWACRARDPAQQSRLIYNAIWGVANAATTVGTVVVCPMGMAGSGHINARVGGYRDVERSFSCTFTATDVVGWDKATASATVPSAVGAFVLEADLAAPDDPTFMFATCTIPKASATSYTWIANVYLAQ